MAKNKKQEPFWTSYSDLMTSLFFVMLVLFIISMLKVGGALKEANADKEDLENILHLQDQFEKLTKSTCLEYDSEKKIFYAPDFNNKNIFESYSDKILDTCLNTVDRVGADLQTLISSLNENTNFSYQLVIEGNAAIDWKKLLKNSYDPDNKDMYILSYKRALALYNRWRSKGINLRKYNTEIIIAGSGFNGNNRDNKTEDYNKRFLIQIIPKIDPPKQKKDSI